MDNRPHYAFNHLIEQSARFLTNHARCDGGFYSQEVGIGSASATTTANCIRALWASGITDQKTLHTLIDELFRFQEKNGAFGSGDGASHNFATAKSVASILSVRPELIGDLRVQHGISYLLANRDVTAGAWGYKIGYVPRPYYTFFAAEALTIAYGLSESDPLRMQYETGLSDVVQYLRSAQLGDGIWGNGETVEPCAINTLTALATLRIVEQALDLELISEEMLAHSRSLLEEWFMNPEKWSTFLLLEKGHAFYIREFFPGNLFLLLPLLSPLDHIAVSCAGWLQRSWLRFNGASIGWPLTVGGSNSEPICVWATSEGLYSLALYRKELRDLSRILPFDEPSRRKKLNSGDVKIVVRSDLRLVLILLSIMVTAAVAWCEIWVSLRTWQGRSAFQTWNFVALVAALGIPITIGGSIIYQLSRFYRSGRLPWTKYRYRLLNWVRSRFG